VDLGTCWLREINCCYVTVCLAAQGASAPTGEERGGGISWRPPAYSMLALSPCVLILKYLHVAGLHLGLGDLASASWFWPRPRPRRLGLGLMVLASASVLASFNITLSLSISVPFKPVMPAVFSDWSVVNMLLPKFSFIQTLSSNLV